MHNSIGIIIASFISLLFPPNKYGNFLQVEQPLHPLLRNFWLFKCLNNNINFITETFTVFASVKCKYKENNMYCMNLETEVINQRFSSQTTSSYYGCLPFVRIN